MHGEAGCLQRPGGLQFAVAPGDQVVHQQRRLPRFEGSLDGAAGAVCLNLQARVDQRAVHFQRQRHPDGQARVGNGGETVEREPAGDIGHRLGHLAQQRRVAHQQPQVNVDGGGEARFEGEGAELNAAVGE